MQIREVGGRDRLFRADRTHRPGLRQRQAEGRGKLRQGGPGRGEARLALRVPPVLALARLPRRGSPGAIPGSRRRLQPEGRLGGVVSETDSHGNGHTQPETSSRPCPVERPPVPDRQPGIEGAVDGAPPSARKPAGAAFLPPGAGSAVPRHAEGRGRSRDAHSRVSRENLPENGSRGRRQAT